MTEEEAKAFAQEFSNLCREIREELERFDRKLDAVIDSVRSFDNLISRAPIKQ